jgi:hypothetical protein
VSRWQHSEDSEDGGDTFRRNVGILHLALFKVFFPNENRPISDFFAFVYDKSNRL